MKIKKVLIKHYRSIKDVEFVFPPKGLLVLVGPNNAGKSNILRAINALLGEGWFSKDKLEDNDYFLKDKSHPIEMEIEFDDGKKVLFNDDNNYPQYFNSYGNKIYGNNGSVKDDFPCTYLSADRSLSKHLEFRSWTLMGKITKCFHNAMNIKKRELEEKFQEVMEIFNSVGEFSNFKSDFINYFEEMQADTPYKLKVDFKSFTSTNYFKNINILASDPNIDDSNIDLDELGEGCRNIVLFSLLRSYAKNFKNDAEGILAIEEPELYMHPQARRHLYNIFNEIVTQSNIQIILTTHSSTFVKTECFDTIGKVYKEPDNARRMNTKLKLVSTQEMIDFCKCTGVPVHKVDNNIHEFYRTTSNYRLNESFFAKFIILVEGETEELALPIYLKYLNIDCDLLGISIIAVNGKNQMPKYWRLFYGFDIPMLLLFDNDNSNGKEQNNKNLCNCFNIKVSDIINNSEIAKVILAEKWDKSIKIFEQTLMSLEQDFETAVKMSWQINNDVSILNKYEQEAKAYIKPIGNQNKGQIARYVAEKLVKNHNFIPEFISKIVEIIEEKQGIDKHKNIYDDIPF